MKTTDYQVSVLRRLQRGAVIEVRTPVRPKRTARFWIGNEAIDSRTISRLLDRGWIYPTRKPGGALTGRAVISKLGRSALWRSR